MVGRSRSTLARALSRAGELRSFARSVQALETLEKRQLLAAHIVGNPTVFQTIQAAVDAAAPGATITVDPGVYSELVVVFKQLTIKGPKAGVDGRSNLRTDRNAEAIVNGNLNLSGTRSTSFYLNANNIVLDGFIIEGQSAVGTYGAGIHMGEQKSGVKILNNIVQNNATGINLSSFSATNPTIIRGNLFRDNNVEGPHSGRAIYSDGGISGGLLTNVIIDDNAFLRNHGFDPDFSVQPAIGFESLASPQTNLQITNNIFDYNGKGMLLFNASNVLISGNVFTHHRDTTSANLRFEGGMSDVTVTDNLFYANGGRAIRIDKKASSGDNVNFTITNNNIFSNGQDGGGQDTGLLINTGMYSGTLNATNNWWGSADGPSIDTTTGPGDTIWRNGNSINWTPWATTPFQIQHPYTGDPHHVTGSINFVDYDHGGTGVAWNDTSLSNNGSSFKRYQGVDTQATTDPNAGSWPGYMIAYVKGGEWIEYTVNVPATGAYDLQVRVANPNSSSNPGTFHVEMDGVAVMPVTPVLRTGSFSTWGTQTISGVNLTAGTHVLRFAFDSSGSSGSVGNFNWFRFVPTNVTQPPAAPSNLAASAPSSDTVNLTWSDQATTETGFVIERRTGANGAWAVIATPAANATSYQDSTVSGATAYTYRVRAANGAGESANSNEASVTTPAAGVTYLSDLPFVGTPINGWGPVERDMGVGGSGDNDGPPITLNGVVYPKGLGAHAYSEILFNLGGQYDRFLSDIGIDDRQTTNGSVIFQVFADNVKIYESPIMRATSTTAQIDVSVAGVQLLKLVVTDAGDGTSFDHADWAGARLTVPVGPTAPAAPSNLSASPVSPTRIDLTWTDNANDETSFIVERSLNGTSGWTQIATPAVNATTYSDTTVAASTRYFYRVRASNDVGPSANSNVADATTPAVPTAPAAPSNLAATAVSPTQINLTWSDNSNNETGFIVERSPNGTGGWTQIATPAANATSYSDTAVAASTQYFYRVRAVNDVGPSANSNVADATTPAVPTPPAAPSNLAATAVSSSQINLSWTDNAGNETGFIIERSPNGASGWTQVGTAAQNATAFQNTTGLSPGTEYFYRVRATNGAGDSGNSNVASATTLPGPTTATYIATGATWKYLDNGSNQGTAWRATSFNDSTWKSGAAELGYGDGDETTVVSYGSSSSSKYITTYFRKSFTVDNATAVSELALRLKRDDGAVVYLNGTEVFRSNMPTGTISYTTRASSAHDDNSFHSTTVNPALLLSGTNVIAVEIHQDNPSSSDISFDFELTATVTPTTPTAPAAPSNLGASAVAHNRIDLAWSDNSGNETGFVIERSPNGVDGWVQIASKAANVTTHSDTTVAASTQYFYRVRANNDVGPSANSNVANATTPAAPTLPAAPSNLSASAVAWNQINLTWTDNSNNETGFIIERSPNGSSGWTQIATPAANATSYSDIGVSASTQYFYRVRATNGLGPSANSNVADATTPAAPVVTNPTFIPTGAVWKYLDNGTNQGTAWRAVSFNDSTWKSGAAELGYGDGDETTVVSFGGSSSNKYITTYFRKAFDVADAASVLELVLRLKRDDGAVVYLNGTEVFRSNMPTGTISYTTTASSAHDDDSFHQATINPALLVNGTNVIAVEIHQDGPTSSDISFDFELKATTGVPTAPAAPSNLSAQAVSSSQINLAWTDNADNESGYIVERSPDGIGGWVEISNKPAGTTSHSDTSGLSASTQYFYRVRAFNNVGPSANSNVASATTQAPTSNPTLIAAGSTWRYLDNGSNQGTAWRAGSFDDSAWQSGAAQLGYGDNDEATVVSYGPDSRGKYITTYFRKSFVIDNAGAVSALQMRLIRDDGVVVYLNGTEVYRNNMPTGTIGYTTRASSAIGGNNEDAWLTASINPALLVSGANVIAVEIHQDSPTSSDISFDLELTATASAPLAAAVVQPSAKEKESTFSTALIGSIDELF